MPTVYGYALESEREQAHEAFRAYYPTRREFSGADGLGVFIESGDAGVPFVERPKGRALLGRAGGGVHVLLRETAFGDPSDQSRTLTALLKAGATVHLIDRGLVLRHGTEEARRVVSELRQAAARRGWERSAAKNQYAGYGNRYERGRDGRMRRVEDEAEQRLLRLLVTLKDRERRPWDEVVRLVRGMGVTDSKPTLQRKLRFARDRERAAQTARK